MSLIVRGLPDDVCDVTELTLQIGSSAAPINYVGGADPSGQRQIIALVSDDTPLGELDFLCEDTRARRYQINLRISDEVSAGPADLVICVGDIALPAVRLTIVRG